MGDNNSNMIGTFVVSNEMLYELLRDFKSDVNRRFDENRDEHMEMNRRMDEMNRRMDETNRRIEELYLARNKVTVSFTRVWAFASFVIALMASGFSLILNRGL